MNDGKITAQLTCSRCGIVPDPGTGVVVVQMSERDSQEHVCQGCFVIEDVNCPWEHLLQLDVLEDGSLRVHFHPEDEASCEWHQLETMRRYATMTTTLIAGRARGCTDDVEERLCDLLDEAWLSLAQEDQDAWRVDEELLRSLGNREDPTKKETEDHEPLG